MTVPRGDDDQLLVQRLRGGDRSALEQLIVRHQAPVGRLVARLTGWSDDAEDLVQDVFVAAIGSAGRFRGDSQISTWLTRIAINVCRSHHRKQIWRADFWKKKLAGAKPGLAVDAAQSSIENEQAARVTLAVRRLKPKYREVVVLHYLQGMGITETARALAITPGAVQLRLHRARKTLKTLLGPWMQEQNS